MADENRAQLVFPADHPCFDGHFPGNPVVPAVAILSELIQQVEGLTHRTVCGVKDARFHGAVGPDVALEIVMQEPPPDGNVVTVSGMNGETLVVRASLIMAGD